MVLKLLFLSIRIAIFLLVFSLSSVVAVDVRGPSYEEDGKTGFAASALSAAIFQNPNGVHVCVVKNLNLTADLDWDSSRDAFEGSLEGCLETLDNDTGGSYGSPNSHSINASSSKVIVFDVGGRLDESAFQYYDIKHNNVAIFGQTAPEPGFVTTNVKFRFIKAGSTVSNVLIQHIGIWGSDNGDPGDCDNYGDAIGVASTTSVSNVVIDHISAHFHTDTAIDFWTGGASYTVQNVDISYSIIGYQIGDSDSCHSDPPPHDTDLYFWWYTDNMSLVGSLLGCVKARKPFDRSHGSFVANSAWISESTSNDGPGPDLEWQDDAETSWYKTYVGNIIKKGTDNLTRFMLLASGQNWDTSEISIHIDDTITYGCSSDYSAACVDDYSTDVVLYASGYLDDDPDPKVSWTNAGKPSGFVPDAATDVAGNVAGSNEKWKVPGMRPGETRLTPDSSFISAFASDSCTPVDNEAWVTVTGNGTEGRLTWPTSGTWEVRASGYTLFEEWVHENYTGPAEGRSISFGSMESFENVSLQ